MLFDVNAEAAVSPPGIQWQKSLGGSGDDRPYSIQQTSDGGYIVAGRSSSTDGDVTGNHAYDYYDYWVVKLDAAGAIEWQKALGGTVEDIAYSVQQTNDGGYIVAGYSYSIDGDVSGNHGGSVDYWVVKLDATGDIVWEKSLGGSGDGIAYSVQQTSEGGYIVAGYSNSIDGDVSGNHGGSDDYWVVKLDAGGAIEWEKALGGSDYDYAQSVQQTNDGGYIVAGGSASTDGDVSGNYGYYDCWVVKLDAGGAIEWEKALGSSGYDYAQSVQQTNDGGYIVAGESSSTDGGNHGYSDYWVVKLDAGGAIEWRKALGGSSYDEAYSVRQTNDGGYIVAGGSSSTDGDVSGNHGYSDYWIVKLDAGGAIEWEKALGGSSYDQAYSVRQTNDGGYIVAGYSSSNNGDVTGNHGSGDFWIVKLGWYSVTFNSQGGSNVSSLTYLLSGSIIAEPAPPTRTGYSFIGWHKEAACINAWNFSADTVTSDITLYAKWTADAAVSPDVPAIPGAVASIDIAGFPLTLAPGDYFTATLTYAASGGDAPDPAPVLSVSVDGASEALVSVDVVPPDKVVVRALPQARDIARGASGNSAVYGEAIINFTATQTVGDTAYRKTAAVPLVIADELLTPVAASEQAEDEFKEANAELVSSDEYILPGNAQRPITFLDPDWVLLTRLDMASIEIQKPVSEVLPMCFDHANKDAADIDINARGLVPDGKKALLPLTFSVTVREESLVGILEGDAALAERVLSDPQDYLDEIFDKIVIQKEIRQGPRKGWYTRLVSGVLKPREAVDKGILEVTGGDALTLRLSYYVLDDEILEAFEQDGYLIVPDGDNDMNIVDPIWVNTWKPGYAPGDNTMQGQGGSGSGGGCASGTAALLAIAACAAFVRLVGQEKSRSRRKPGKDAVFPKE